jgi:hypothetical protein
MKFKEIWNYSFEGKLFILWCFFLVIFFVIFFIFDDLGIRVLMSVVGYSVVLVPLWILAIIVMNKRKLNKIEWKGGLLFEYMFFLFLFCSQIFLAFFIYYVGIKNFDGLVGASIGVLFFFINAVCAGLCHYIYKFDDN